MTFPFRAIRVICRDDVIVPANSEFILEGKGNSMLLDSDFALISLSEDIDINGLITGNSLLKSNKNDVNLPVRVANVTCENLTIKRGTTLGFMQSIEECGIMQDRPSKEICQNGPTVSRVSKGNGVNISSWSKPLQDLFHRSSE